MPVHLPTPNFANWPRSPANLALSPPLAPFMKASLGRPSFDRTQETRSAARLATHALGAQARSARPSPLDVEIEDIAHGLARVARWNGQTRGEHIFSVAQHSLLVEKIAGELEP